MDYLRSDRFLIIAVEAAEESGEKVLATAIRRQGMACQVSANARNPLDLLGFGNELEDRLRLERGFRIDFQIPTQILGPDRNMSQIYDDICDIAEMLPVHAQPVTA